MDINSDNKSFWEKSINTRRSVRSFERKPLESKTLDLIKEFTDNIEVPFNHDVTFKYFKSESDHAIANNLRKPPEDMLAFISNTDLLSIASAGFLGELAILYATGLGVSTCWFGHYILREVERLVPHLGENPGSNLPSHGYGKGEVKGKRVICITPLGYFKQDGLRLIDRLTENMMSFKRKPISERLEGVTEDMLPEEIKFALNLAQKAPSAANTQHWRFNVSKDLKTITIAKPSGYTHMKWEHPDVCVGACAAHFFVGLSIQEIPFKINLIKDADRALWQFNL